MFDTHCHLNFSVFKNNLNRVINNAKRAGVNCFVVPGTDFESSKRAIEIAEKHDGIYAAVGIHPHHVCQYQNDSAAQFFHTRVSPFRLRRDGPLESEKIVTALFSNNLSIKQFNNLTIAVQGFGNVGYYFAKIAHEMKFKIVAVSDSKGGVYVKDGLSPEKTLQCKKEKGSVAGCYCKGSVCDVRYGKPVTNEELLELPVDILVPAALENVINEKNMKKIRAKIIIEMANGPITEEAYNYLINKGVIIVPDVLANSGGVTVSYLEWLQGKQRHWWTEAEVNQKLAKIMEKAFAAVWKRGGDLKKAAFELAIEKLV